MLVVCRSHKLGGIDHALFQCGIQVARSQLLRDHTQLGQNFSCQSTYAKFQAFEIGCGFNFFAVPTGHLCAGVAHRHIDHTIVAVKRIEQFNAATHIQPSILSTGIQAKGQGGAKTKGRVFADVEITGTMACFYCAILNTIEYLQGR